MKGWLDEPAMVTPLGATAGYQPVTQKVVHQSVEEHFVGVFLGGEYNLQVLRL